MSHLQGVVVGYYECAQTQNHWLQKLILKNAAHSGHQPRFAIRVELGLPALQMREVFVQFLASEFLLLCDTTQCLGLCTIHEVMASPHPIRALHYAAAQTIG